LKRSEPEPDRERRGSGGPSGRLNVPGGVSRGRGIGLPVGWWAVAGRDVPQSRNHVTPAPSASLSGALGPAGTLWNPGSSAL